MQLGDPGEHPPDRGQVEGRPVHATGEQRRIEVGNAVAQVNAADVVATRPVTNVGDLLTARVGRQGFLARELLDEVPTVLRQLRP